MKIILDNGSYSIKAGTTLSETPVHVQNAIAKTKDSHIYVGNDYLTQTNNYSGINIKRPHDQGHLTSWETEKPIWDYTFDQAIPKTIDFSETHLTLTETPFQLPQLSINTDLIVFEEYGFNSYFRAAPASFVPWLSDQVSEFSLVIDSGHLATWIVPVIYQKVYWKGVKKLPVGGRVLNGLLKELVSFRHYDVSEEPLLVNTIKEQTSFISLDFAKSLAEKNKKYCDFVLPDFKTTATGYVKQDNVTLADDVQFLRLSDERFVIPESLFHPEILFDNNASSASNSVIQATPYKSLIDLIVESIMSCPELTRPLVAANISLAGGTSKLANFKERILQDVKKEFPGEWVVKINDYDIPNDEIPYVGAVRLTEDEIINNVSVSKQEYFEHGLNWCQKQFGFQNL